MLVRPRVGRQRALKSLLRRKFVLQQGYCHWCHQQAVMPPDHLNPTPRNSKDYWDHATLDHMHGHKGEKLLDPAYIVMACRTCNTERGRSAMPSSIKIIYMSCAVCHTVSVRRDTKDRRAVTGWLCRDCRVPEKTKEAC